MALRSFFNEIRGMRVKDLPAHLKPILRPQNIKVSFLKGLDNYHAKYIVTSSYDPVIHVGLYGMIFSYFLALPEERRHFEHQQHAKEHGGH